MYMDTDSVIFWTTPLMPSQILLGHLLGEWTDELADYTAKLCKAVNDPEAEASILLLIILAPKAYCELKRAVKDKYCTIFKPEEYIRLKVCL